ncbi:MAG: GNAT family N-acetyltransferase [Phycisphaerales bacterium]|nr:GNAT family N-acetyltransferase [Phycisphaerales bacterium]
MNGADATSPALRMVRPDAARLLEAAERLVGTGSTDDRLRARRFLDYARQTRLPLDDLWTLAGSDDRLVASALAIPGAGRIAMLFSTRPRSTGDVTPFGALIRHASEAMAARNVVLTQALVEPQENLERQAFLEAGFRELATLCYMERAVPKPSELAEPSFPEGATAVRWSPGQRQEMLRALEATYEDTLDCPGLCGLRQTEDILEGHLASGRYEPGLWHVLREHDRTVGVLLFSPASTGLSIELVYFGLAAAARGRGLGRLLLQHGLRRIAGRRERKVTLAVDEANEPALRLYRSFGFSGTSRRVAFVRPL